MLAFSTMDSFAKHLTAEIEKEEFVPGKGVRRFWDTVSHNNHWLDATVMSAVGASMAGVALLAGAPVEEAAEQAPPAQPPQQHRERRREPEQAGGFATAHRGRWSG